MYLLDTNQVSNYFLHVLSAHVQRVLPGDTISQISHIGFSCQKLCWIYWVMYYLVPRKWAKYNFLHFFYK